ncbi:MAG: ATP-binding cassette domain-containing protein [Bacteroidales bacterium]|nr:ATP-binding cassette domain-containing protein [Bacteroidales bacterium]
MLEIKDIYKSFGEQKVLQGANMSIKQGKIYTMVGGNGTGKTTLFNLITGFLKPDKGEILLSNKRLDKLSPIKINSKGITRTFQDLRIINQLTVKENILLSFKNNPGEKIFNSFLPYGIFKKKYDDFLEKTELILEKVHLKVVENNLADEISYGQQKLLTIGCCLANDAQLLLLDEPVAGIDKDNYTRIYDLILGLKKEGRTILQIEHNHKFVESLSDEILFLNTGKVVAFENYKSFVNDQIVKETYFN